MKAVGILTDSPNNNNNNTSPTTNIANGRVSKNNRHRDIENEEVQMYLSKLRDLVPFMPRGRRLSKLEVIQNVIDYICDLQSALEAHPAAVAGAAGAFDAAAVLSRGASVLSGPPQTSTTTARQPLGVRSSTPNTILMQHHQQQSTQIMDHINSSASSSSSQTTSEKQQCSSPPDGRSVSSSC